MDETSRKRIVANCATCGDVKLAPSAVTIRNCVDDDGWSYWFICPSCHRRAAASTGGGAAFDAVCAGATLDTWRLPAEIDEWHDGPPLTFVDLCELHLLLLEPDWIDQLA